MEGPPPKVATLDGEEISGGCTPVEYPRHLQILCSVFLFYPFGDFFSDLQALYLKVHFSGSSH